MDLNKLNDTELLELYSNCIIELKQRGIARTNSITGEIGKHIVVEYYNNVQNLPKLSLVDSGVQGYDTYDCKGKRYSIKTCTGNTTGGFLV